VRSIKVFQWSCIILYIHVWASIIQTITLFSLPENQRDSDNWADPSRKHMTIPFVHLYYCCIVFTFFKYIYFKIITISFKLLGLSMKFSVQSIDALQNHSLSINTMETAWPSFSLGLAKILQ